MVAEGEYSTATTYESRIFAVNPVRAAGLMPACATEILSI